MPEGPESGEPPIRFGTSGWRGILAEDFTFSRLRRALHGLARWLREEAAPAEPAEVVVARDTRWLGERMTRLAVSVLREHGLRPLLARGAVPTPVAARTVLRRGAAAGLVFTASHNPPEYQGLKVLGSWGGGIGPDAARRIEALAAATPDPGPGSEAPEPSDEDCVEPYLRELLECVDAAALARSGLRVHYDAMHGAAAGVLDVALTRCGVSVRLRRAEPDPGFGGCAPDPRPEQLLPLAEELRAGRGLRLGLATDGDGDRFGVVDADGRVLSESSALALLVEQLASTGRARRGVAISVATGSLVERVAAHHGLAVLRRPIGFKFLSRDLVEGRADVAGEESGGFAWSRFAHDKDGILAGLLLAERVATTRAPLARSLVALERRHGGSACGRSAIAWSGRVEARVEQLCCEPPERIAGACVRAVTREDGLRAQLDDGFLLWRRSGTEPLLRVYAEAASEAELATRLEAGRRLVEC